MTTKMTKNKKRRFQNPLQDLKEKNKIFLLLRSVQKITKNEGRIKK